MVTKNKNIKSIEEIKEILTLHKKELEEKYPISSIGIFGSYIRGEQRQSSDLDILVEFNGPIGMFKFLDLEYELRSLLELKKIDLVTKGALKPNIGKHILEEVCYL